MMKRYPFKTLCLLFFFILSTHTKAQIPVLLKDIQSGSASGFMSASFSTYDDHEFRIVWQHNGFIYFTAVNYSAALGSSFINDIELFKSDGTTAGTSMVKDINPGNNGSDPKHFVEINGLLYFSADDGTHGRELWKTDGTSAGTSMVKDIDPGSAGCFETAYAGNRIDGGFAVVWQLGNTFYFTANDNANYSNGNNDIELWKSDGTTAGTVIVKDISPGLPNSSTPKDFEIVNSTLYFSADDGSHGRELWKSDGTTAGTVLVKDIDPGSAGCFETAYAGNRIDETFDIVYKNGNTIYFTANDNANYSNGNNDYELWKSDGTTSGTVMVKDISPGLPNSSYPRNFHVINNMMYFSADDGSHGRELWKSDGTTSGTVMIKDIDPGTAGCFETAYAGTRIDGAFAIVWQIGNTFYFTANDNANYSNGNNDIELWKSDGTTGGTSLVKDISPGLPNSSSPQDFEIINNTLFFSADDGSHGRELWKSDGTTAGTILVKDIDAGAAGCFELAYAGNRIDEIFEVVWQTGNTFYFRANSNANYSNGANDYELWKSDGTTAGTVLVKDINPGIAFSSTPRNFHIVNNTLYFAAQTEIAGTELWKSDGTASGTQLVKDIDPGTSGCFETAISSGARDEGFSIGWKDGNNFYFAANDNANYSNFNNDYELWKSDGTTSGTVLLKDINPGIPFSSFPREFEIALNKVFFTATSAINGRELWTVDIITGVTENLFDNTMSLYPNPSSDYITVSAPSENISLVEVMDLNGKIIYKTETHNFESKHEINVADFSTGMYIVKLTGNKGSFTRKFIKE